MALRSVYIETTVVSYLVARPSRHALLEAHQRITKEWWSNRKRDFDLFVSQVVLDEAAVGEKLMAERRLESLAGLPVLEVDDETLHLAEALTRHGLIPAKAARDALHIAVAAVHELDFLLTWNCAHLANAEIAERVERIVLRNGRKPPKICTPEQLMGGAV